MSLSLPSASNGAGALNLQISGPTQISPQVLGKLDEALAWWAKAREAARKQFTTSASSSAAMQLRQNLVDLTDKLFTLQTKLEHYKMVGYGDMGEVKQHLGSMANGLVELQECLRALSAMG